MSGLVLMSCGSGQPAVSKGSQIYPIEHECVAFSFDFRLCNSSRDANGRPCIFDEGTKKCTLKPVSEREETNTKKSECVAFSFDSRLCNSSRDANGRPCIFDESTKKCLIKPVPQQEDEGKLEKAEALKKAQKLIGSDIADFCKVTDIGSNSVSQGQLHDAVLLLKFAANDASRLCADEYQKLEDLPFYQRPNEKCINTLLDACIDPKDYGSRFLESLARLEKTSQADRAFLDKLIAELTAKHDRQRAHGLWGVKNVPKSYLETTPWIVDSPRYNDKDRKVLDPQKHSENFLRAWGDAIASAEDFLDIATLVVPQGRFMDELKRSLKILDAKNKPIIVRMLFGAHLPVAGLNVKVKELLDEFKAEISPDTKLKLYIASLSGSSFFSHDGRKYFSWNHSKIVAVDGRLLLTGGHNLFKAYLDFHNPVHDISLEFPGDIALIAHLFCDYLWNFAYWAPEPGFLSLKYGEIASNSNTKVFRSFSFENADKLTSKLGQKIDKSIAKEEHGSERVIAVSRLANMFRFGWHQHYNVSDLAKIEMIKSATNAIYISQQAIYPIIFDNEFNKAVIEELLRAMLRGVEVFVLKSSDKPEISGGIDEYNSGKNRRDTFKYLYKSGSAITSDKTELLTRLFRYFLLLNTANGRSEVPNHAKVLIVDTKASSVGSHNLYDMSHAEFEIILRNPMILLDYFAGFWFSSIPKARKTIEKTRLDEYNIGDHVFVQRSKDHTSLRAPWTLGRVVSAKPHELIVEIDFLNGDDAKRITITDASSIKNAP